MSAALAAVAVWVCCGAAVLAWLRWYDPGVFWWARQRPLWTAIYVVGWPSVLLCYLVFYMRGVYP